MLGGAGLAQQLAEVALQRLQIVGELGPEQRQHEAQRQHQQPGSDCTLRNFHRLASHQSCVCKHVTWDCQSIDLIETGKACSQLEHPVGCSSLLHCLSLTSNDILDGILR